MQRAFANVGAASPRHTSAPGDEVRLVRDALEAGATTIAVLGGDGTWSKCAAALVSTGSADRCRLAFLAGGTGNDFVKSLDAPAHDPAAMAELCADPRAERRVDMARLDGSWFLNVAGFGYDAAVVEAMLRPQWLRGRARYVGAALSRLHAYPGTAVSFDDGVSWETTLLLAVANGRAFGGAFRIAPSAQVDDGALDLVSVGDAGLAARLVLFARVVLGRHEQSAAVRTDRARAFTLRFRLPPLYQADGELHRAASDVVTIESVPQVLRVASPRRQG